MPANRIRYAALPWALLVLVAEALCVWGAPPSVVRTPPPARPRKSQTSSPGPATRDWIFAPGLYTHDRKTGNRVDQYEKTPTVYRVPNDHYYAPNGPHPYGPDYEEYADYPIGGFGPWGVVGPHYVPFFQVDPFALPALVP